jgi:hypothetical protein
VILLEDRGFTIGWGPAAASDSADVSAGETEESLTQSVLNAVLPDDEEVDDEHPWSWLPDLAHARGLDVTAESMQTLPNAVIFSDKVEQWPAPPDRDPEYHGWERSGLTVPPRPSSAACGSTRAGRGWP